MTPMTDATPPTPKHYDIFLSYPSADRIPATALKAGLKSLGLEVWMDTERIDNVASIQRNIEGGMALGRLQAYGP